MTKKDLRDFSANPQKFSYPKNFFDLKNFNNTEKFSNPKKWPQEFSLPWKNFWTWRNLTLKKFLIVKKFLTLKILYTEKFSTLNFLTISFALISKSFCWSCNLSCAISICSCSMTSSSVSLSKSSSLGSWFSFKSDAANSLRVTWSATSLDDVSYLEFKESILTTQDRSNPNANPWSQLVKF